MSMDLSGLMNIKATALRKWMMQLLGDRYPKHDLLVERLGAQMMTQQDLDNFGKLAIDLYELGYLRCLEEYRKKMDELGIKVKVVSDEN